MASTLQAIREALAIQIAGEVTRETNVKPYRVDCPFPRIIIEPASDYLDFWTSFGASGLAEVRLVLVVEVGNVDDSARIRLDDYLAIGTANVSSVVDAVMSDRTLGGLVDDCVPVGRIEVDDDAVEARIPVTILLRKVGATV